MQVKEPAIPLAKAAGHNIPQVKEELYREIKEYQGEADFMPGNEQKKAGEEQRQN